MLLPGSRILLYRGKIRCEADNLGFSREGADPHFLEEGTVMDGTTIIRVVAGVLFVIILVVLIQRRRTQVK
jgi:hypothetical protein